MIETLNVAAPVRPPRRLAEVTRTLARRGLDGEFGRQMVPAALTLKDVPSPPGASPEMEYAHAVQLIAETAPLRVLPDERIVGSTTYLEAPHHLTPIHGGKSTSHLTLGFDRALGIGYQGLREQIQCRLARGDLDAKGREYLEAMEEQGLSPIFIFSPTTSDARMAYIASLARGFIYCVARKGVTGADTDFSKALTEYLARCRTATSLPLALGFGVKEKADIDFLRGKVEIAVIGTQMIRLVENEGVGAVEGFIRSLC